MAIWKTPGGKVKGTPEYCKHWKECKDSGWKAKCISETKICLSEKAAK